MLCVVAFAFATTCWWIKIYIIAVAEPRYQQNVALSTSSVTFDVRSQHDNAICVVFAVNTSQNIFRKSQLRCSVYNLLASASFRSATVVDTA